MHTNAVSCFLEQPESSSSFNMGSATSSVSSPAGQGKSPPLQQVRLSFADCGFGSILAGRFKLFFEACFL